VRLTRQEAPLLENQMVKSVNEHLNPKLSKRFNSFTYYDNREKHLKESDKKCGSFFQPIAEKLLSIFQVDMTQYQRLLFFHLS